MSAPRYSNKQLFFTLAVLLFVAVCFFVLVVPVLLRRPQPMLRSLNAEKQLHLAMYNMAADRITLSNTNIGWPGDSHIDTVKELANQFVAGGYIKREDLGVFNPVYYWGVTNPALISSTENNIFRFTRVEEADPANTIVILTCNWTGTLRSGTTVTSGSVSDSPLYSERVIIVFRKGGDGAIYNAYANSEELGIAPQHSNEFLK